MVVSYKQYTFSDKTKSSFTTHDYNRTVICVTTLSVGKFLKFCFETCLKVHNEHATSHCDQSGARVVGDYWKNK